MSSTHPSPAHARPERRALLAALAALPFAAQAQQPAEPPWPAGKTVRIVVAYPAGGVSDVVARALAERLAQRLGATVVVENKAGASGSLGMDAVAKAVPDGSVLGFSSTSPLTLNPFVARSPFDPQRDIAPVASVMASPVLLLATSALPAAQAPDFRALLALARQRPGAVRWATSGQGSVGHILLEQVMAAMGVQITHVPYKGGGQQLNDALGGQFEILSTNAAPAIDAQVKAGKLRPLAAGAPARLQKMPRVPTLGELGLAAANRSSLFGIFAPGRTPAPLVQRINAEVNAVLAEPDFRARLVAADNLPAGGSAADFARQIAAEAQANARTIAQAGIKGD